MPPFLPPVWRSGLPQHTFRATSGFYHVTPQHHAQRRQSVYCYHRQNHVKRSVVQGRFTNAVEPSSVDPGERTKSFSCLVSPFAFLVFSLLLSFSFSFFRFLLFSSLSFIFSSLVSFFFYSRLSCVCVVIGTTCNIYVRGR